MKYSLRALLILLIFTSISSLLSCKNNAKEQPNVLFIAVDDLNDWIGCLGGHPQTITPNLDKLASEGILFTNAHCQAPICGPSRASIMTGLAPATTGIYLQIKDKDIKEANEAVSKSVFLPDYFELNGYKTIGAGKIYHQGDEAKSFDEFFGKSDFGPKPKKRFKYDPDWFGKPRGTQTDWGAFPETDAQMPDFKTAEYIVEKLKEKHDKPFFMAAGFVRPHVPWYVPQKWFDMHPIENIITPPYRKDDMEDVPEMGQRIAAMPTMPTTEWAIENGEWENIVQSYLACITFVDAQIGKVLDALAASNYAKNTIIVLWSDHGYHIGEKNRFAKQAIWERDTRTVLMFKVPGKRGAQICDAPAQLIDIYPTLAEYCELEGNKTLDGRSLVPLLENTDAKWDHIAVTSYGQGNVSLRSKTHRYIRYEDGSEELYNMVNDPNEWTNLALTKGANEIIEAFKTAIPKTQEPLSIKSEYNVNEYWKAKVKASKKID